jgi:hypothetical protein
MLTRDDIQRINIKKSAISGRIYKDIYGKEYIGLGNGTLIVHHTDSIPLIPNTQIAFGDSSNLLTSTSTFVLNGDNLGIGTATPSSLIHTIASGSKTSTYSGHLFTNIATSSTSSILKSGIEIKSTGTWNGSTASNVGLYISSVTGGTSNYDAIFNGGGSVLIGSTSPISIELLSLQKNWTSVTQLRMRNTTAATGSGTQILLSANTANLALFTTSTSYLTGGIDVQNTAIIFSSAGAGINIGTSNATPISIWTNNTQKLVITSDGRLYGTALHNNVGSVTGSTNQYIASGTRTATADNLSNCDTVTPLTEQWMRVGNVVTVSGGVEVDPTAAGTTSFTLDLGIATNATVVENISGIAVTTSGAVAGSVSANFVSNLATIVFTAASGAAVEFRYMYTYVVLS